MRPQAKKVSPRGNNPAAARIGRVSGELFGSVSPLMWERLCRAGSAAGLAASPRLTGPTFCHFLRSLHLFGRRVVVRHLPAVGELAHDQREPTTGRLLFVVLLLLEHQLELPAKHRGV